MFLISKIVRGRRLLHELEAAQAAQKIKDDKEAHENTDEIEDYEERLKPRSNSKGANEINRARSSKKNDMPSPVLNSPKGYYLESCNKSLSASNTPRSKTSRNSVKVKRTPSKRRKNTVACDDTKKKNGKHESDDSEGIAIRRTSSMPSVCDDILAVKNIHYDYDSKLNRLQKRALRFTWHRLLTKNGGKRPETVFEEVFDKLTRIIPSIKEMFATRAFLSVLKRSECSTLRDHAKVTVKMIDLIIKNLDVDDKKRTDTGSSYDPKQIGTSHAQFRNYGITGQYWEKFGEVLIDVVLQQEAIRDLPGANLAWVSLAACIVDQLRVGFDQKCSSLAYSSNVQSTQIKIQDTGSGCTFSQQRQYGQSSVNSNESRSNSIQSLRKNSCQAGAFISAREASSERRERQKMFIRGQSESTDDYDSHFNQSGRSRCPYSIGHAYSAEERKITLSDLQLQSSDVPSRNIIYNSINPANEMIRPMILSYNNHSSHHNNHNNHNNEYANDERTLENGGSNRTLTNSRGNLDNIYHSIQNCLTTND